MQRLSTVKICCISVLASCYCGLALPHSRRGKIRPARDATHTSGLFQFNSEILRTNQAHRSAPLRARELTTPRPEGLTARLVPVEVDLKPQIFDVCSSLNNGHSPKGRLRQLCAKGRNRSRGRALRRAAWPWMDDG